MVNTIEFCLWFVSVQIGRQFKHSCRLRSCQWYPDATSIASCPSTSTSLWIWTVPSKSRSCSASLSWPLATVVKLRIIHCWIALSAPTLWLLASRLLSERQHCSLRRRNWYATTYSTSLPFYHLQLRLLLSQELVLAALVGDSLNQSSLSLPTMKFWLPSSWFLRFDGFRINLVRESLDRHL